VSIILRITFIYFTAIDSAFQYLLSSRGERERTRARTISLFGKEAATVLVHLCVLLLLPRLFIFPKATMRRGKPHLKSSSGGRGTSSRGRGRPTGRGQRGALLRTPPRIGGVAGRTDISENPNIDLVEAKSIESSQELLRNSGTGRCSFSIYDLCILFRILCSCPIIR